MYVGSGHLRTCNTKQKKNTFNDSVQQDKALWVVSSTFQIAQILVQSHFEQVSSVLAHEATELVSEPVTQMAVELINTHLISVQ